MWTGADEILAEANIGGAKVCFANPGTTELPLVDSLERRTEIRAVPCLFEGVCAGAADGYARVTDAPALTLLHLGPGLANAMANLHNARRARSGLVNLVGDHPLEHLRHDSPLTTDIEGMARTVSDWVRTTRTVSVCRDTVEALQTAVGGDVSTLIVPVDVQAGRAHASAKGPLLQRTRDGSVGATAAVVQEAAGALREPGAVLYLGGRALRRKGLELAERIRAATGCTVFTETLAARVDRGQGTPWFASLPYFPEVAAKALASASALVCAGAPEPVGIFAVAGMPGTLAPTAAMRVDLGIDGTQPSLEALADAVGPPGSDRLVPAKVLSYDPSAAVTAPSLGNMIAAQLPEGAVVVEEAATNGYGYSRAAAAAPPHLSLGLTGGAIGIGLPMALGAAIGSPGARVVALQADGSAMYTNQALWTIAREGLDVTVVILSNARYAILQAEMQRAGARQLGPVARSLTSLDGPPIDWTNLARAMGVGSVRCRTNEELASGLATSFREAGPMLLQVDLA